MTSTVDLKDPPEYRGNWLTGVGVEFVRDPLRVVERMHAECGDIVRCRLGPPRVGLDWVSVSDPDMAGHILDSPTFVNYRKDNRPYVELAELIGNGLLTSQDETWQRQRRIIQPVFTARVVDSYVSLIDTEAQRLIGAWHRDHASVVDVNDEMSI